MIDLNGTVLLDRYEVEDALARGGMATVYHAHDRKLKRWVVVKLPHAHLFRRESARRRFAAEIEELQGLEHPHVVRILDKGEFEGRPFIVLQHLGGGSVESRMRANPKKRLSTEEVLPWLSEIAQTLDFVHAQGVVHRDVKPTNILFDEHDNAFLSDFGLARTIDFDLQETEGGRFVGTPSFVAPEQVLGQDVTAATDQYSLAVTVCHALTGRLPFRGVTPFAILDQKRRAVLPELPDLPSHAQAALRRALAHEPAKRFATCAAFVESFQAGLAAPVLKRGHRPRAARRRDRAPPVALLAALGVVVASVIYVLTIPHGEPAAAPPDPPSAQQPPRPEATTTRPDPPAETASTREPAPSGAPRVTLREPSAHAVLDPTRVWVSGTAEGSDAVFVLGHRVAVTHGAFLTSIDLSSHPDGPFSIVVRCQGAEQARPVTLDRRKPQIVLLDPQPTRETGTCELRGFVKEPHLTSFTIDGERVDVDAEGSFRHRIRFGDQIRRSLVFRAADQAGHEESFTRVYKAPVRFAVKDPSGILKSRTVNLQCQVQGPPHAWRIRIDNKDGGTPDKASYTVKFDGRHRLSVQLMSADQETFGRASVVVRVDEDPPRFEKIRVEGNKIHGELREPHLRKLTCNGKLIKNIRSGGRFWIRVARGTRRAVLVATDVHGRQGRCVVDIPVEGETKDEKEPVEREFGVLEVDGSSGLQVDRVSLPHAFTLECWFKPRTAEPRVLLSTSAWALWTNCVRFQAGFFGSRETADAQPRPDAWNHIAFTYDARRVRCYLNGEQVLQARVGATDKPLPGATALIVTKFGGLRDPGFTGRIDDVRLSEGVLYHSKSFEPSRRLARTTTTRLLLRFDEPGGMVEDLADPKRVVRSLGLPQLVTDSLRGPNRVLFLSDDVASVSLDGFPSTYTIEFWLAAECPRSDTQIVKWGLDGYLSLARSGDLRSNLYVRDAGGGERVVTTSTRRSARLEWGKWSHVAVVFDGKQHRVYVDGALAGTGRAPKIETHDRNSVRFASIPDTVRVDDVRVSRGARYTGSRFAPRRYLDVDADTVLFIPFDLSAADIVEPKRKMTCAQERLRFEETER